MLIQLPVEIPDKELAKLIAKNNKLVSKGKAEKAESIKKGIVKKLFEILDDGPNDATPYLFLASLIAEESPESISESMIEEVLSYLDETRTIKEQINALSIFGFYILYRYGEDPTNFENIKLIGRLIEFLDHPDSEFRHNVAVFLEQIEPDEELIRYLMTRMDLILDLFVKEDLGEVLTILGNFLEKIQERLFLMSLLKYIKKLTDIYWDTSNPIKMQIIRRLFEKEISSLSKLPPNSKKKNVMDALKNRSPLKRVYNIDKMAEEEEMEPEEVLENLKLNSDSSLIYHFLYKNKGNRIFIEIELEPLLKLFNSAKAKLSMDKIKSFFNELDIKDDKVIEAFIKSMVKDHLIKGYLSSNYWYPYEYIRDVIQQDLNKKGYIEIGKYTEYLSRSFFETILNDIIQNETFQGIYNKDRSKYYALKYLIKKIEELSTRSNTIDLNSYLEEFDRKDFLKLENYARDYFTQYHDNHVWLTNLGKTRLELYIKKSGKLGLFNIELAEKELKIPQKIIRAYVNELFKNHNGFWDKDEKIFYYSKYIKKEISQIQNIKEPDKRMGEIHRLAQKFNLDDEEISKKVDEKLYSIGKRLMSQDKVDIKRELANLQMDYDEFIGFIDNLDKPYLIIKDFIIFNPEIIEKEKKRLKDIIREECLAGSELKVDALSSRLKCSPQLIVEFIQDIMDDGEIEALWLDEDVLLTRKGIESRILSKGSLIDLHTIIRERHITPAEMGFIERILKDLIESGRLKGVYNAENHLFTSDEIAGKLTLEQYKENFKEEIEPYFEKFNYQYGYLKAILLNPDVSPADIDEYERIIAESIQMVFDLEPIMKRLINNANRNLRRAMADKEKGKKTKGNKKKNIWNKLEQEIPGFEDDEDVKRIIEDYEAWKDLFIAIEQKAGNILFLQKKIKNNPEDEESKRKLNEILEYLGFLEE